MLMDQRRRPHAERLVFWIMLLFLSACSPSYVVQVLERQRSAADILRTYPELLESPKSFEVTMTDDFLGVDYSLYAPSDDFTARVVYDWSDKMYPSETWHLAQFVSENHLPRSLDQFLT